MFYTKLFFHINEYIFFFYHNVPNIRFYLLLLKILLSIYTQYIITLYIQVKIEIQSEIEYI